jgi:hypothetical protein
LKAGVDPFPSCGEVIGGVSGGTAEGQMNDGRNHQCSAEQRKEADALPEEDGRGSCTEHALGTHDNRSVSGGCVTLRNSLKSEGKRCRPDSQQQKLWTCRKSRTRRKCSPEPAYRQRNCSGGKKLRAGHNSGRSWRLSASSAIVVKY